MEKYGTSLSNETVDINYAHFVVVVFYKKKM